MLYIVLLLVLAALGLLVAALITSKSLFAWISIGLSIAAAVALFVDWLTRRRAERRAAAAPEEAAEDVELAAGDGELAAGDGELAPADAELAAGDAELAADGQETSETPTEAEPATAVAEPVEPAAAAAEPDEPAEEPVEDDSLPDEEETDAADLLIVCELDDQVIVVDEHPRYHLEQCRWLGEKDTIPIAVSEARELGFTPCARCGPDAKLAEQARGKRRAGAS